MEDGRQKKEEKTSMASIITGIFKKNKTGKQLVDLLVDHLNAIPTATKIKEVTKVRS